MPFFTFHHFFRQISCQTSRSQINFRWKWRMFTYFFTWRYLLFHLKIRKIKGSCRMCTCLWFKYDKHLNVYSELREHSTPYTHLQLKSYRFVHNIHNDLIPNNSNTALLDPAINKVVLLNNGGFNAIAITHDKTHRIKQQQMPAVYDVSLETCKHYAAELHQIQAINKNIDPR